MTYRRPSAGNPWFAIACSAILLASLGTAVGCSGDRSDLWSRHDAHRRCPGAIADYPDRPAPPCRAMHMCANEAQLTGDERQKLLEMIGATEDCDEP